MLQKEFKERASEIIKKTVEIADLLEECDCEEWGDIVYIDDHFDMTNVLLQITMSASCIALNLAHWNNKGQSEYAANPEADSPRVVAGLELKTA